MVALVLSRRSNVKNQTFESHFQLSAPIGQLEEYGESPGKRQLRLTFDMLFEFCPLPHIAELNNISAMPRNSQLGNERKNIGERRSNPRLSSGPV
jgi:hypothetical protein